MHPERIRSHQSDIPPGAIPTLPALKEPIADVINDIKARRITLGLPVFDLNQGLVKAPAPLVSQIRAWHHAAIDKVDPSTMSRVAGSTELRQAVAEWRESQFSECLTSEDTIITPGANAAWNAVLQSLSVAGDTVALVHPYFFNHHGAIESSCRRSVYIDLAGTEHDFLLKAREVLSSSKPRLLVLSNPHNPTGVLLSRGCVKQLESLCSVNGAILVIDESYGTLPSSELQFLSNGDPLSLTKTIVIGSFTKSLCLADLRLGYVITNQENAKRIVAVADDLWIAPSQVTQLVALDALAERSWIQGLIEERLLMNRDTVDQWERENPHLAIDPGNRAVFAWLKLPFGIDDVEFVTRMAIEEGVMTTPGSAYGTPGFIRLGYGMIEGTIQLRSALEIIGKRLGSGATTFPSLTSLRT